jgi:hypothetical protein
MKNNLMEHFFLYKIEKSFLAIFFTVLKKRKIEKKNLSILNALLVNIKCINSSFIE